MATLSEQARAVVALHLAVEAINGGPVLWENYPDIGENDWDLIVAEVLLIAARSRPPQADVDEAMDFLAVRANSED